MEAEKDLKKRVKIDEGKNKELIFSTQQINTAPLRNRWMQLGREEKYELLQQELQQKNVTIEQVFSQEARSLLNWAIVSMSQSAHLHFICNSISKKTLLNEIKRDNFSLLNAFLFAETGIENIQTLDAEKLKNRSDKIQLLLSLGDESKEFIEKSLLDKNIGNGVKSSIREALSKFSLQQKM